MAWHVGVSACPCLQKWFAFICRTTSVNPNSRANHCHHRREKGNLKSPSQPKFCCGYQASPHHVQVPALASVPLSWWRALWRIWLFKFKCEKTIILQLCTLIIILQCFLKLWGFDLACVGWCIQLYTALFLFLADNRNGTRFAPYTPAISSS